MSSSKKPVLAKGQQIEEVLRNYFISSGFVAIRGISYQYRGDEITDIDLWLYIRNSILSRQIINVDIKNKKRSGSRERIVWAKGIKEMLQTDGCIVATKDDSPLIRSFGKEHGVVVIGGSFLKKLQDRKEKTRLDRLSEEELQLHITPKGVEKGSRNESWYKRVTLARTVLLSSLNFSGLNFVLEDLKYFLSESTVDSPNKEGAIRSFHLCLSYFLIIIDYLQQQVLFLDEKDKKQFFKEGLMYGKGGKETFRKYVKVAEQLNLFKGSGSVEYSIEKALEEQPFDILVEYISTSHFLKDVFALTKKFDQSGYTIEFNKTHSLPKDQLDIIFILADFFDIDRRSLPF